MQSHLVFGTSVVRSETRFRRVEHFKSIVVTQPLRSVRCRHESARAGWMYMAMAVSHFTRTLAIVWQSTMYMAIAVVS